MGLFDFFTGGSPEKQIRKYSNKIRAKDTPVEERQAAGIWLANNGSPQAVLGLLGRFEMTYEHSMKDAAEKEEVANLLLSLGGRALEPLEVFIRRSQHFARALKAFEQIAGKERTLKLVLELLDVEFEKGELKPNKKRHLLIKLGDYVDPRLEANVVRFLDDFDEGVRYAACEVMISQGETDSIRATLIKQLVNEDEESNRVRVRIAETVIARSWDLQDHVKALTDRPPPGYTMRGGKLIKAA